uniref:Uncharacterized protein n=1 Tax=Arundo donax TaxID=35708 RepID=A0A0A9C780_ARUDO
MLCSFKVELKYGICCTVLEVDAVCYRGTGRRVEAKGVERENSRRMVGRSLMSPLLITGINSRFGSLSLQKLWSLHQTQLRRNEYRWCVGCSEGEDTYLSVSPRAAVAALMRSFWT